MRTRVAAPMGLALALGAAAGALAQTPGPPASVLTPAHAAAANTVIGIEIAQPISTRTAKPGDMFAIRLSEPISAEGVVIVPAGIPGQGQVVDAGRSGMLGKPAKLVLAARYLDWNGQRIPLHGFNWAQGAGKDRTRTVEVAGMVPYAGMLAMFIHGGEVDVPEGAHAVAKLGAPVSASIDQTAAQ
jgi:hypothetical protein